MILKKPTCYSTIISLGFHLVFVLVAGSFWLSQANTPPVEKPFQLKIVSRPPPPPAVKKSKPIKAVKKRVVPVKKPMPIPKSHRKRETAKIARVQKMVEPSVVPVNAKPKMLQEYKVYPSKESFQMARADISANAAVPRPRTIEKLPASEIIISKVQRSSAGKAKPVDISPSPRPVENVRVFSKVSGKETRFHASAVGFAPVVTKPKSVSVTSSSSIGGRATAHIRDDQKVIANGLPQARTITVAKTLGADQKRAVKFKSGLPSRSLAPKLVAIRPSVPEFESMTTPDRAARFYEAKTRTVSTLPLMRASSVTPPSNRGFANNKKTSFVQKGELVASSTFPSPRPVPDIVDPRILDGYLGTLQKLIASAKQYPESARKSGREGKVTVQFTVLKNGDVKNIQLVSKTNYPELNEEAIEAVKRAAPFSGLPEEIGKPFLDIVLPFRFKLSD